MNIQRTDTQALRGRWLAVMILGASCLLWLALRTDARAASELPGATSESAVLVVTATLPASIQITPTRQVSPVVITPTVKPEPLATRAKATPTATLAPTPLLRVTALPGATPLASTSAIGRIGGRIGLEVTRPADAIRLSAAPGNYSATVASAADFEWELPAGTYTLTARADGFLSAQRAGVVVRGGQTLRLGALTLLCGDISGDGVLGVADLALVGSQFARATGFDPRADVNGDGRVNILDLVLLGGNFGKASIQVWGD